MAQLGTWVVQAVGMEDDNIPQTQELTPTQELSQRDAILAMGLAATTATYLADAFGVDGSQKGEPTPKWIYEQLHAQIVARGHAWIARFERLSSQQRRQMVKTLLMETWGHK